MSELSLAEAEARIEAGLEGYRQAIATLREIRSAGFYPNFLTNCERRWGMQRVRILNELDAIGVLEELIEKCQAAGFTPAPRHEEEIRPLVRVPRSEHLRLWQKAQAVAELSGDEHIPGIVADVVRRDVLRKDDPPAVHLNPWIEVGARMRDWRLDRGISQDELRRLVNKELRILGAIAVSNQSTISFIESGKQRLNYVEALAICRVLDAPLDAFSPWKGVQR